MHALRPEGRAAAGTQAFAQQVLRAVEDAVRCCGVPLVVLPQPVAHSVSVPSQSVHPSVCRPLSASQWASPSHCLSIPQCGPHSLTASHCAQLSLNTPHCAQLSLSTSQWASLSQYLTVPRPLNVSQYGSTPLSLSQCPSFTSVARSVCWSCDAVRPLSCAGGYSKFGIAACRDESVPQAGSADAPG